MNDVVWAEPLTGSKANVHHDNEAALKAAVASRSERVVKALLNAGANVHVDNDQPLRIAARRSRTSAAILLLEAGARILSAAGEFDALHSAIWHNDIVLIKEVLKSRPPANICNHELVKAAISGNTNLLKILSTATDIHFNNNRALIPAAVEGRLDSVKALFQIDREGYVTCLRSAKHQMDDGVEMKCDVTVAIEKAMGQGYFSIVKFLLKFLQENEVSYKHVHGYEEFYNKGGKLK
ncbi:hypothetical protein HDV00_009826 [Rhizophlyctis rosea]|nr:hypothetical protein HDV00_009826 [Rhizophlyctis rosea]